MQEHVLAHVRARGSPRRARPGGVVRRGGPADAPAMRDHSSRFCSRASPIMPSDSGEGRFEYCRVTVATSPSARYWTAADGDVVDVAACRSGETSTRSERSQAPVRSISAMREVHPLAGGRRGVQPDVDLRPGQATAGSPGHGRDGEVRDTRGPVHERPGRRPWRVAPAVAAQQRPGHPAVRAAATVSSSQVWCCRSTSAASTVERAGLDPAHPALSRASTRRRRGRRRRARARPGVRPRERPAGRRRAATFRRRGQSLLPKASTGKAAGHTQPGHEARPAASRGDSAVIDRRPRGGAAAAAAIDSGGEEHPCRHRQRQPGDPAARAEPAVRAPVARPAAATSRLPRPVTPARQAACRAALRSSPSSSRTGRARPTASATGTAIRSAASRRRRTPRGSAPAGPAERPPRAQRARPGWRRWWRTSGPS